MGATSGAEPQTVSGRVRRWFAELGFHQMWQLGVVIILAATALFGGLDDVDTKVTEFQPGKAFSDGQFTVTVDRATSVTQLPGMPARPGRRYLGVVTDVRNDGTLPGTLKGVLDLHGRPGATFAGAVRMADGSPILTLGPGLSDQIAFVWDLPAGALHAGDEVTLRAWEKKFVEYSVTYGQGWVDSLTNYGQVTVPVKVNP